MVAELGGIPANNRNDCDIKAIIVTNAVPGTSPTLHAQAPAPPYMLRRQPHLTHSGTSPTLHTPCCLTHHSPRVSYQNFLQGETGALQRGVEMGSGWCAPRPTFLTLMVVTDEMVHGTTR